MDKQYIKALNIISKTKSELKNIYNTAEYKGLENSEVSNSLDKLLQELEDVKNTIEYFSGHTKEGYLIENSNGKYEVEFADGNRSYDLSCGSAVEINVNGEWFAGRVEHKTDKGYYFYNSEVEHPVLHQGMKARLRKPIL